MKGFWVRYKADLALRRWPVLTPKEADREEQRRIKRWLESLYRKFS